MVEVEGGGEVLGVNEIGHSRRHRSKGKETRQASLAEASRGKAAKAAQTRSTKQPIEDGPRCRLVG